MQNYELLNLIHRIPFKPQTHRDILDICCFWTNKVMLQIE